MRTELQILIGSWSFDIPFERAVRKSYPMLQKLVALGLTWTTIAAALTKAGARHRNGRPISARQMNSVFLRVGNAQSKDTSFMETPASAVHIETNVAEVGRARFRATVIASGESGSTVAQELASQAPASVTGLAQRLNEARRLSNANRIEYDD